MEVVRQPVKLTDAQLLAATGKNWQQWAAIVAAIAEHAAARLRAEYNLDTWWSEVIAAHCAKTQHRVRVTRTIEGSLRKLFQACRDAGWGAVLENRPTSSGRRALEASYPDGSHVTVRLTEDRGKTRVTADHSKLGDLHSAEKMRHYWAESLNRLREEIQ